MGRYVNPATITKEQWLRENASAIVPPPTKYNDRHGMLYVCHVTNTPEATAALIVDSQSELNRVIHAPDHRPKQWYAVPIERLNELPGITI